MQLEAVAGGVLWKKAVPKSFLTFKGKQLCWSLFLIKLETFRSATLLKRDSNIDVFPVNIAKFLRTPLLKNICGCFCAVSLLQDCFPVHITENFYIINIHACSWCSSANFKINLYCTWLLHNKFKKYILFEFIICNKNRIALQSNSERLIKSNVHEKNCDFIGGIFSIRDVFRTQSNI